MSTTYFDVLGVSPDVSDQDLKRAWRARMRVVHPDHGGTRAQFDAVQAAYQALCDQAARDAYRATLSTEATDPFEGDRRGAGHGAAGRSKQAEPSFTPPVRLRMRATALSSVAFSVALSIVGAVISVTTVASGIAAAVGLPAVPVFSVWSWWVGSFFAATLCAQMMIKARSRVGHPFMPAVAFACVASELVVPYLSLSVAFAGMLALVVTGSCVLLLIPLARRVVSSVVR